MIALLAAIVAAGIILPHALRLQRVHPVTDRCEDGRHWCLDVKPQSSGLWILRRTDR